MLKIEQNQFSASLRDLVFLQGKAIAPAPVGWLQLHEGKQQIAEQDTPGAISVRLDDGTTIKLILPQERLPLYVLPTTDKTSFGVWLRSSPVTDLLKHPEATLGRRLLRLRGAKIGDGDDIAVYGEVSALRFSEEEKLSREAASGYASEVEVQLLSVGVNASAKLLSAKAEGIPTPEYKDHLWGRAWALLGWLWPVVIFSLLVEVLSFGTIFFTASWVCSYLCGKSLSVQSSAFRRSSHPSREQTYLFVRTSEILFWFHLLLALSLFALRAFGVGDSQKFAAFLLGFSVFLELFAVHSAWSEVGARTMRDMEQELSPMIRDKFYSLRRASANSGKLLLVKVIILILSLVVGSFSSM